MSPPKGQEDPRVRRRRAAWPPVPASSSPASRDGLGVLCPRPVGQPGPTFPPAAPFNDRFTEQTREVNAGRWRHRPGPRSPPRRPGSPRVPRPLHVKVTGPSRSPRGHPSHSSDTGASSATQRQTGERAGPRPQGGKSPGRAEPPGEERRGPARRPASAAATGVSLFLLPPECGPWTRPDIPVQRSSGDPAVCSRSTFTGRAPGSHPPPPPAPPRPPSRAHAPPPASALSSCSPRASVHGLGQVARDFGSRLGFAKCEHAATREMRRTEH